MKHIWIYISYQIMRNIIGWNLFKKHLYLVIQAYNHFESILNFECTNIKYGYKTLWDIYGSLGSIWKNNIIHPLIINISINLFCMKKMSIIHKIPSLYFQSIVYIFYGFMSFSHDIILSSQFLYQQSCSEMIRNTSM